MATGVAVQFKKKGGGYGGKKYTYLTDRISDDLEVGDLVIVAARDDYRIVRVCKLNVPADNPHIPYKQIQKRFVPPNIGEGE